VTFTVTLTKGGVETTDDLVFNTAQNLGTLSATQAVYYATAQDLSATIAANTTHITLALDGDATWTTAATSNVTWDGTGNFGAITRVANNKILLISIGTASGGANDILIPAAALSGFKTGVDTVTPTQRVGVVATLANGQGYGKVNTAGTFNNATTVHGAIVLRSIDMTAGPNVFRVFMAADNKSFRYYVDGNAITAGDYFIDIGTASIAGPGAVTFDTTFNNGAAFNAPIVVTTGDQNGSTSIVITLDFIDENGTVKWVDQAAADVASLVTFNGTPVASVVGTTSGGGKVLTLTVPALAADNTTITFAAGCFEGIGTNAWSAKLTAADFKTAFSS
jgi:hypothetical protein